MPSFNRVLLMGNCTRDPELKNLPGGSKVAEWGLAVNRKWKTDSGEEREDVLFVDVVAFGRQAEVVAQYFTKGKPMFVEGRLKYDTWEDRDTGAKRSKISVVLEGFQFIGGRDDGGGERQEQRPPARQAAPPAQRRPGGRPAQNARQPPSGEEEQFDDNDIPF